MIENPPDRAPNDPVPGPDVEVFLRAKLVKKNEEYPTPAGIRFEIRPSTVESSDVVTIIEFFEFTFESLRRPGITDFVVVRGPLSEKEKGEEAENPHLFIFSIADHNSGNNATHLIARMRASWDANGNGTSVSVPPRDLTEALAIEEYREHTGDLERMPQGARPSTPIPRGSIDDEVHADVERAFAEMLDDGVTIKDVTIGDPDPDTEPEPPIEEVPQVSAGVLAPILT